MALSWSSFFPLVESIFSCAMQIGTNAALRKIDPAVERAAALGAGVHVDTRVTAIDAAGDGVTVFLDRDGTIMSDVDYCGDPARVEVFDLESGQSLHVFSGDAKGLVEQQHRRAVHHASVQRNEQRGRGENSHQAPVRIRSTSCFTVGTNPFE